MSSIDKEWPNETPERAVADAFSAFRRGDVASLATGVTSASIRALAAHAGPELDTGNSRTQASSADELTESQATSILGRVVARLPQRFTDSVRCLIVGHVLESRIVDGIPDGRGLISLDCRVTGADNEWLSVHADRQIYREIVSRAAGVAHVVFGVAHEFPGEGIAPSSPDLQIATTQIVGGEWKLALDEWSDVGLPGFRGVGLWIDEGSRAEAGTDD